jgi:guanine deaminase
VEDPIPTLLRGRALAPRADAHRFDLIPDALLEIGADGRFLRVEPAPPGCDVPETHPGAVLLPGFVDTHVHFPQTRVVGSATGPLLDWLARTVFAEESRFAERTYAEVVAREFCDALIAQGTTCAAIYGSSHPEATDALFAELDRRGLRGFAGLTLMDRGAPAEVLMPAPWALEACRALADRWHGHDGGRLQFAVTPRFALSCTSELMRGAGRLAAERGLLVQTHLSENRAEIEATHDVFPECADYLAVYERHGLVGERSIFGHAIWLSEGEWVRMAARNAAIAHCPDSNFFLGSGLMPLRKALDRGVRVGLGSDVGAGRTFSLRRVAARAYDVALLRDAPVAPEALLWHATLGGARALGIADRVGRLAPGYDADLVAVDVPAHAGDLFDALLFRDDHGPARAAYVRGRRLA